MVARFKQDQGGIQEKVKHLIDRDALDLILTDLYTAKSIEEARAIIWDAVGKAIQ